MPFRTSLIIFILESLLVIILACSFLAMLASTALTGSTINMRENPAKNDVEEDEGHDDLVRAGPHHLDVRHEVHEPLGIH